jgi:hypothetical protein
LITFQSNLIVQNDDQSKWKWLVHIYEINKDVNIASNKDETKEIYLIVVIKV